MRYRCGGSARALGYGSKVGNQAQAGLVIIIRAGNMGWPDACRPMHCKLPPFYEAASAASPRTSTRCERRSRSAARGGVAPAVEQCSAQPAASHALLMACRMLDGPSKSPTRTDGRRGSHEIETVLPLRPGTASRRSNTEALITICQSMKSNRLSTRPDGNGPTVAAPCVFVRARHVLPHGLVPVVNVGQPQPRGLTGTATRQSAKHHERPHRRAKVLEDRLDAGIVDGLAAGADFQPLAKYEARSSSYFSWA